MADSWATQFGKKTAKEEAEKEATLKSVDNPPKRPAKPGGSAEASDPTSFPPRSTRAESVVHAAAEKKQGGRPRPTSRGGGELLLGRKGGTRPGTRLGRPASCRRVTDLHTREAPTRIPTPVRPVALSKTAEALPSEDGIEEVNEVTPGGRGPSRRPGTEGAWQQEARRGAKARRFGRRR